MNVALGGLLWFLTGDFDDDPVVAPTTAPSVATTTPTTASVTTTAALGTTIAPTTTASTAAPTTATPTTTTTTTVPEETVAEFLVAFRKALDDDNLEFLFDRLHPIVRDEFGADLCRDFIEREIAALDNYAPTADIPDPRVQPILGTDVDLYEVPIEFDFQGQHFEAVGTFALVDGRVHYLAECR